MVSDSGYCRAHRTKSHGDICLVMAVVHKHKMNSFEWALVLTLSVLWGGSFFFVGVAVRELPTFTMVVAQVAIAAVVLLVIVRARGGSMPSNARIWGAFLVMGFLNNIVPFSFIVWGQAHIASGVASILNATTPLVFRVSGAFLCQ